MKRWNVASIVVCVALGVGLGALALLGLPGCSGGAPRRPNILIISIDTLRADHLGCYGHPAVKTPNIDRLAAEGTLFTQCTSVAPLTLPAHCSLLTATYPFVHGARDNGQFQLHAGNETLTEALKADGYATICEVAAVVLDRVYGMDQGFDTYGDVEAANASGKRKSKRALTERSAEEVADAGIAALDRVGRGPFFMLLHFFDPHHPLMPPERFAQQYLDPYLGEIAYVDEQVGRVLAALKERKLDEHTIVVLTADHGEGRGQHNEATHSCFIYDATQTVPLIFRRPGQIPVGRVSAQVRQIDVAPTLLAMAGLDPLPHAQGVDLNPLITGRGADLNLAAYSETMHTRYNFGFSQLRALRAGGWKYILAPKPELYHVAQDVGEEHNLIEQEPQRAAEMRAALQKLIAEAHPAGGGARRVMSDDEIAKLRSQGYAVGGSEDPSLAGKQEMDLFEPQGPDPKDYAEDITRMISGIGLAQMGQFAAAEQMLREVLDRLPPGSTGLFRIYNTLGTVLAAQGRFADSLPFLEKALEARPGEPVTLTDIGIANFNLQRLDPAFAALEAAVRTPPESARTHMYYGVTLAMKKRPADGLRHLDRAIQLAPTMGAAYANKGVILARTGRVAEAVQAYEKAVQYEPANERYRRELTALKQAGAAPGQPPGP